VYVPGLLGPLPPDTPDGVPSVSHLERLLARSDRSREPRGYAAALFDLFDIGSAGDGDLPTAAIAQYGETGTAPDGYVMHADPLQLVADRDSVLAFGLDDAALDADETGELVEAFNRHFGDEGLRLLDSVEGTLYLHCERPPSIRTHPLASVIGRSLDPYLPEGGDRRRWRGLLNETQMLCHSMTFNQKREVQGRATVAGLWFSGGGVLPPRVKSDVGRVTGDCRLAAGLMAYGAGAGKSELIVEHAAWRALTRADLAGWERSIVSIDRRLPAWQQDCTTLHLHPCNGTVYHWHKGADRRFWRRRRPLAHYQDRVAGGNGAPSGLGV